MGESVDHFRHQALENDFDGSETVVLPDILVKLLYALTYNRQIK